MKHAHAVPFGALLEGRQLDTANTILRYHGLPERGQPLTVGKLLESLTPMELGRWTHICRDPSASPSDPDSSGGASGQALTDALEKHDD
jgi:hypothetical protein